MSTCHIPFYPLIGVSLYLLVLSVSNFTQALWRCGQLFPYIGMGSLGTRMRWDCNAMGEAVKISPCVPSTHTNDGILSFLIIHITPGLNVYLGTDDPSLAPSVSCLTTSGYLFNYVCTADIVSHAENLKSKGCRCVLTCTNFKIGSKLPECSGIVVSTIAIQSSTKAQSSFRHLVVNSRCSCHRRRPFNVT
jgi:hypothetical protein